MAQTVNKKQLNELVLQMIETELGGEQVYRTALTCALNDDLKKEWEGYLDETLKHQELAISVAKHLDLDPNTMSAGREVVKHLGESFVKAMKMAKKNDTPEAAQLVACECVVLAETKDHTNWELFGKALENMSATNKRFFKEVFDQVEQQEDHHLFHTRGWCRELWIDSLGMPAVLPPPEEVKQVETEIGASRAKQQRDSYL
ncbi:MAG TPA: hypothetical protein DD666_09380 [Advenella kashmirensis]|uniref:DUF892 domain-containing protein n=1 Tax=Advenella kashmirensis TaxID=310575 RepID=A0A356LFC0_9BURK|nr:hypothetical protein [Advenella kashmirensis]